MFGSLWNFLKRHKKKLLLASFVTGGGAVLYNYAKERLLEFEKREAHECVTHARRQHHFDSNQRTCNMTVVSMLPNLREAIFKLFETEAILEELKQNPSNKIELWQDMKTMSFARAVTVVYGCSLMPLFLRVQLNIIGGYMYLDNLFNQNGLTEDIVMVPPTIQERYLSLIKNFFTHGKISQSQTGIHITLAELDTLSVTAYGIRRNKSKRFFFYLEDMKLRDVMYQIDEVGMLTENKSRINGRFMRYIVIFLLAVITVGSLTILGIGIWTHEVEYGSHQLSGLIGQQTYRIDSLMMIGVGSATLIITIIGFIAILKEHKCLLGLHLAFLAFLSIMLFVAGILGYSLINELEDSVKDSLVNSIKEDYGVKGRGSQVTKSWDRIQRTFECCGAYGNENSSFSWALYKESFWIKDKINNGSYVPASCCGQGDIMMCQGRTPFENAPPIRDPPVLVHPDNYTLYTTGCFDKLEGYLVQNGILLGTTAIVVGTFM
ncbi:hypothetical protein ScPMuIL_007248, partial [Solemya velum]